jgi:oligoendopeptidase F
MIGDQMSTTKIPLRKEIQKEYTWNAESVFPTKLEWEDELKQIVQDIPSLTDYRGKLNTSSSYMADALQTRDRLINRIGKATMYAFMSMAIDTTDQEKGKMPAKAQAVFGQVLANAAFVEPELLEIGEAELFEWVKQDNRLEEYEFYFRNLFRKQEHIRSTEIEEILGMLTEPFSNVDKTFNLLTDADFQFKPAINSKGMELEVTQGSLDRILSESDSEARKTAWENYMDTYLAYKNTLASNLETSIKQFTFESRVRKHRTTLEASLFEHNIPTEVFHNLIDTFRDNLHIWQRYFNIRRKALGVEKLESYDIWAPLVKNTPIIPFEKAIRWICDGLSPMGEEYVERIRKGCVEDRWVDLYPNQGKSSGAFSYGAHGTFPFIVMSYTDDVFSMSTLAHELGHSMHSYLTWQNQPVVYGDYSLFVAEVASNFHQAMVRAYLLENEKDTELQISLIEEAMANFYRYFLQMPTLARFELETHQLVEKGEGLNADGMIQLMADLFQEAYGDSVHIDHDRVGITWATFGHLYEDYYVYQYATGISGAHALANRILQGTPGAVDDYLGFLKSGSSLFPLDTLKNAGVDLTTPKPVEETFKVLAQMVDRLDELLG